MSTHSARSDRAINCFFLCFFNFIFLVTKFEIGRNNLLLFQKLIYRTYCRARPPQQLHGNFLNLPFTIILKNIIFWSPIRSKFHWDVFQKSFFTWCSYLLKGRCRHPVQPHLTKLDFSLSLKLPRKYFNFQWSQLCAITTSVLILACLVDSLKPSSRSDPNNFAPELRYT